MELRASLRLRRWGGWILAALMAVWTVAEPLRVLCIGDDGHAAFEWAGGACCTEPPGTACSSPVAGTDGSAAAVDDCGDCNGDGGCGDCVDVPTAGSGVPVRGSRYDGAAAPDRGPVAPPACAAGAVFRAAPAAAAAESAGDPAPGGIRDALRTVRMLL